MCGVDKSLDLDRHISVIIKFFGLGLRVGVVSAECFFLHFRTASFGFGGLVRLNRENGWSCLLIFLSDRSLLEYYGSRL